MGESEFAGVFVETADFIVAINVAETDVLLGRETAFKRGDITSVIVGTVGIVGIFREETASVEEPN